MTNTPCFGIAGWKNSGKTSLVSALVSDISSRGLKVSTIKHAHHSFDLDTAGTDSFKHRVSGAQEVVLVSQNRWAIQHELRDTLEPTLEEMRERLSPCDLVLIEGYKHQSIPKIEIIGDENNGLNLWPEDTNVKAIACDTPLKNCDLPQFKRSQGSEIADFILEYLDISR